MLKSIRPPPSFLSGPFNLLSTTCICLIMNYELHSLNLKKKKSNNFKTSMFNKKNGHVFSFNKRKDKYCTKTKPSGMVFVF